MSHYDVDISLHVHTSYLYYIYLYNIPNRQHEIIFTYITLNIFKYFMHMYKYIDIILYI